MYLSRLAAQKRFGCHPKTLAAWADEGKIEFIRTPGGHRRYLLSSLEGEVMDSAERMMVIYGRVSTHSQKGDLDVQCNFLLEKYPKAEVIKEVGSGLNFKRRKFLQLMNRVTHHEIDEIVIGHKDRLCRFGFDFVEWFCSLNYCQITVLGQTNLSPYQELMQDFMSIMHCFSSRLYFLRRYKKEIQNAPEVQQVEQCH